MDINYDLTTIYIKPQFEDNTFIHFDSSSHLNQFIKYNKNLWYGHKCCSDKGIKVNNISNQEINLLKKDFLKYINHKSNKKKFSKENLGECSICYENKSLKNTTCNHSFCYGCYQSWTSIKKECPMCRRPL